jgi:undecaprenyl-diphosphatase
MPGKALDQAIIAVLNGLAGRSPAVDRLVLIVAGNHLMKGGVVMALVWWAWFSPGDGDQVVNRRTIIIASFAAAAAALALSAFVQFVSPFRPRPIHNLATPVRHPIGPASDVMSEWSSFPSDHATLFFALATGLLLVSRGLGIVAFAYVTLVIALPRVYLGWHYPTDILGGMVLGCGLVSIAERPATRERLGRPVLAWSRVHPQAFHAIFFLVSYQVATLMDDTRVLASFLLKLLRGQLA